MLWKHSSYYFSPVHFPHLQVPSLVPGLLLKDRSEYITDGCLMKQIKSSSSVSSLCTNHLVQTWLNLHFLFWSTSFRSLSIDCGGQSAGRDTRCGRETAWGQHNLHIDGCWQARPGVHIHSFDALMQVSSAQRWGTSLKVLTGMLSKHPQCSSFHITIAALNVVKLD